MKVLVFGNPFVKEDTMALRVGKELEKKGIKVKEVMDLDELEELRDWSEVVLVDTVKGLKEVKRVSVKGIEQKSVFSIHDLDLGFYLKVKKKLGELKEIKIIGVPMKGNPKELSEKVLRTLKRI
jgi:Ni,Fe-hydrogenase maturation factor